MLFTMSKHDFESEKERNLYYKYFAGYYFNELIADYENRLSNFCMLLNSCKRGGKAISINAIQLTSDRTHVSFDNHGYLFYGLGTDRGEFADILIHDRSTKVIIPIEAKVHSDWSYEKDVLSNEIRLSLLEDKLQGVKIFPCLLLTKSKWEAGKKQNSKEYSNYRRLRDDLRCRTRVVFWEELLAITNDKIVRKFVETQLVRRTEGFHYNIENGWFVKRPR